MLQAIDAAPAGSLVQPAAAAVTATTNGGLHQAMFASCVLAGIDRPPCAFEFLSDAAVRELVEAARSTEPADRVADWQSRVAPRTHALRWNAACAAVRRVFTEWPASADLPDFYAVDFSIVPAQHG